MELLKVALWIGLGLYVVIFVTIIVLEFLGDVDDSV